MIIGPVPVFLASLSLIAPLDGIVRSIVAATAFSLSQSFWVSDRHVYAAQLTATAGLCCGSVIWFVSVVRRRRCTSEARAPRALQPAENLWRQPRTGASFHCLRARGCDSAKRSGPGSLRSAR